MIPKRIIYCWFGGKEKSEIAKSCIDTWKKNMPDWEYLEINETNFDINYNKFVEQAYSNKKWAFVSDVARLWALYNYGGIYMDTDVSVYKPLDEFLNEPAFSGFEGINYPVCATMGAEKGNPIIKEMLDYYDDRDFEPLTNTKIMSNILANHGIDRMKNEIQRIDNFTIYQEQYFNNVNGYTKHHMEGSWLNVKVSIIMPVYNQEELVIRALDSIPKRDDIEIIIINDGSTDNTLKVCQEWVKRNPNARVVSYEENKGLGHAKNVGFDNAVGRYINELDSDDYLYTKEYEKVIDELDGTDIVYMDLQENSGYVLNFNDKTKIDWGSQCARFIRRDFLGDTRCPEIRYAEDWYLSNDLNKKNPTEKYTHIIGYHYNSPREGSLCYEARKELEKRGAIE